MQAVHAIVSIAKGTGPAIGPAPLALVEGAEFAAVLAEGESAREATRSGPTFDLDQETSTIGVPAHWSPMPESAVQASMEGDPLLDEESGPPARVPEATPVAAFEPTEAVEPMAAPAIAETAETGTPLFRITAVSARDLPARPGREDGALVQAPAMEPPVRPVPSPSSDQGQASPLSPVPASADTDVRRSAYSAREEMPASDRAGTVLADVPRGPAVYPPMRADTLSSAAAAVPAPGTSPVPDARATPVLRAAVPASDRTYAVLPDAPDGTAAAPSMWAEAPSLAVAFPPPPPSGSPLRPDLPRTEAPEFIPPVQDPIATTVSASPAAQPDTPHPPAPVPLAEAIPAENAPPEVRESPPIKDTPASQLRADLQPDIGGRPVELVAVPAWLRVIPAWLEIATLEQGEVEGMAGLGQAPGSPAAAPGAPLAPAPPPIATPVLQGLARHQDGTTEITLSPEELGTVRLRLRPDPRDHERMVVMLSFDRPETLDLFRRHGEQLAEAIRSAGYAGVDIGFDQGGEAPRHSERSPDGPATAETALHPPLPPARSLTGAALDLRL